MGSSSSCLGPWRGLLQPPRMRRPGSWIPIPWEDFLIRRADTRAGEPVSGGNGPTPEALQVPGCVLFMAMMFQAQCLAAWTQR